MLAESLSLNSWPAYFLTMGILFAIYCVVRFSIWDGKDLREPSFTSPRQEGPPGNGIDAAGLSQRLHHIRQDYTAELPASTAAFKKPILVEQKRRELEKLSFFRRPATPDLPERESESGPVLMLI